MPHKNKMKCNENYIKNGFTSIKTGAICFGKTFKQAKIKRPLTGKNIKYFKLLKSKVVKMRLYFHSELS